MGSTLGWLALVVPCAGCGPGEDCESIFQYSISVDVHGAEGKACEVALGSAGKIARYEFATPCTIDWSNGTTLADSPEPTSAAGMKCHVLMSFAGDAGHELAAYVGTESIPMSVTCGGSVVKVETLEPMTRRCAG